jgi:hypothetical protein
MDWREGTIFWSPSFILSLSFIFLGFVIILFCGQTTAIRPQTRAPIIVCDEVDQTGTLRDVVEVCR